MGDIHAEYFRYGIGHGLCHPFPPLRLYGGASHSSADSAFSPRSLGISVCSEAGCPYAAEPKSKIGGVVSCLEYGN